ncbi:unnamed protein product [Mycena citricolor]|uniref:Uncharacterized protein n=1 Tax=Mycena citricolor TaxID=2018698 RepID=A0AAD2Q7A6_9AGAR|nr:unnamed protein product [Mycena citricolor]
MRKREEEEELHLPNESVEDEPEFVGVGWSKPRDPLFLPDEEAKLEAPSPSRSASPNPRISPTPAPRLAHEPVFAILERSPTPPALSFSLADAGRLDSGLDLDAEPLEKEDLQPQSRSSTASAQDSRRKRHRTTSQKERYRNAARAFILDQAEEAQASSDEEDDEGDLEGFIVNDCSGNQARRQRADVPGDTMIDPLSLAEQERIENEREAARFSRRLQTSSRLISIDLPDYVSRHQYPSDERNPGIPLDRLPDDSTDPLLYPLTVPAGLEHNLLVYLTNFSCTISVFYSHERSGLVYTETQDTAGLRRVTRRWRNGSCPETQVRSPLPALEKMHVIKIRVAESVSPDDCVGAWVRPVSGRHLGDLALRHSQTECLVVPRLPDPNNTAGTIRRLFSPQYIHSQSPEVVIHSRGNRWEWNGRIFLKSGLEVLPATSPRSFALKPRPPTEAELGFFRDSRESMCNVTSVEDPQLALQEGDWVVVVDNSEDRGKAGVIVCIPTRKHGRTRVAAVLPHYNGVEEITAVTLSREDLLVVPLASLARHILSPHRPFDIRSRLKIVSSSLFGGIGHAIDSHSNTGYIDFRGHSVEGNDLTMTIPWSECVLDFRVGDVVEIVSGPSQGTSGFILDLHIGGFVDIYPCTAGDVQAQLHGTFSPTESLVHDISIAGRESLNLRVPTFCIRTIPSNDKGYQFSLQTGWQSRKVAEDFVSSIVERHKILAASEEQLMYTGHGYVGQRVMIIGKHDLKGRTGVVVGYSYLKTSAPPEREHALSGSSEGKILQPLKSQDVQLSVSMDLGGEIRVAMKQVVHPEALIPLRQAMHWRNLRDALGARAERNKTPEPVAITQSWMDEIVESKVPEDNELWLADTRFLTKRLDLRVVSEAALKAIQVRAQAAVNGRKSRLFSKFNARTFQHANMEGVLHTNQRHSMTAADLKLHFVKLRIGRFDDALVPAQGLLPVRTLNGACISAIRERVIIIGCNVATEVFSLPSPDPVSQPVPASPSLHAMRRSKRNAGINAPPIPVEVPRADAEKAWRRRRQEQKDTQAALDAQTPPQTATGSHASDAQRSKRKRREQESTPPEDGEQVEAASENVSVSSVGAHRSKNTEGVALNVNETPEVEPAVKPRRKPKMPQPVSHESAQLEQRPIPEMQEKETVTSDVEMLDASAENFVEERAEDAEMEDATSLSLSQSRAQVYPAASREEMKRRALGEHARALATDTAPTTPLPSATHSLQSDG